MSKTIKISRTYRVTQEQINQFALASGGMGKIHTDPAYAEKTQFKGTLIHGLYLVALIEKELALIYPNWKGKLETTFVKPIKTQQAFKIIFENEKTKNNIKVSILLEDKEIAVVGSATLEKK